MSIKFAGCRYRLVCNDDITQPTVYPGREMFDRNVRVPQPVRLQRHPFEVPPLLRSERKSFDFSAFSSIGTASGQATLGGEGRRREHSGRAARWSCRDFTSG